jgi:hypothetical protein
MLTYNLPIRTDGEVTRMGGGESYRPTARARSPPRADTFRASDRDRERDRRSPPPGDSYQPNERRRSPAPYRRDRTPPRRDVDRRSGPRDSDWRSRPRSPPRFVYYCSIWLYAITKPTTDQTLTNRARSPPRRFSPRRDDRSRGDDDRRAPPRSPRRDDRYYHLLLYSAINCSPQIDEDLDHHTIVTELRLVQDHHFLGKSCLFSQFKFTFSM